MSNVKRTFIAIFSIAIFLGFAVPALQSSPSSNALLKKFTPVEPTESLIPIGVDLQETFVAGKNKQVGTVQLAQGKVYVIHEKSSIAYRLDRENPLFEKDTIITQADSRLNAVMNDKSLIALAPLAKATLTRSQYDEKSNERSSVIDLLWGSARFIVQKISGQPDFTVKTKTAVCGVRGTDFAVSVAPYEEEKTASLTDFLDWLGSVREAHAFIPGALATTVVTGPSSSVALSGIVGAQAHLPATSMAVVVSDSSVGGVTFLGASVSNSILNLVGPQLAALEVPPHFQ